MPDLDTDNSTTTGTALTAREKRDLQRAQLRPLANLRPELYDEDERWVRHIRLEYDVAAAMKRILDAGLPRFLAERLQWGE